MLTAFLAWLVESGAGLLLGFLANVVTTAWRDWQNAKTQRELGQVTAERDQAIAGRDAAEAMAQEAAKSVSEDDAIARLNRGEG
jgi:hypothetical protein